MGDGAYFAGLRRKANEMTLITGEWLENEAIISNALLRFSSPFTPMTNGQQLKLCMLLLMDILGSLPTLEAKERARIK